MIIEGQKKKQIRGDLKAEALAEVVMSVIFGGQTMARMANDPEQIRRRKADALSFLKP